MARQIFLNLPVADLQRSIAFFETLGFRFDPRFTDDKASGMIVDDNIFVMLLTEPFFATFTRKPVADASASTEVLVCVSCESRDEVDRTVDTAIEAGAREAREPQDHGFMFARSFEDPDGHIWEFAYMEAA